MSEQLEIYDLDDNLIGIEKRDKFYDEIKKELAKTGKVTKKIKTVRLILLNSSGRMYLQKRSKIKAQNPNLYDKTIGGHALKGESYNMAMIRECAEELGFPAAILSDEEFNQATNSTDLKVVSIIKKVDFVPAFKSIRSLEDGQLTLIQMCMFYIGFYDGPILFSDGESSGIEVFSLEELKDEIKLRPKKFTEDIKFMIKKYEKHLIPIKK